MHLRASTNRIGLLHGVFTVSWPGQWTPAEVQNAPAGEARFRVYGPQKALCDKTWVLPDIEKVN